jgi:WxL domain surface cell wall-binding
MRKILAAALLASLVSAGALVAGGVSPAQAACTPPTGGACTQQTESITLSGGSLAVTAAASGTFSAVSLNGLDQTSTATVGTITVTDPRGTGAGWKLTADTGGSSLSCSTGGCSGKHLGALSIGAPSTAVCHSGSTCTTGTMNLDNVSTELDVPSAAQTVADPAIGSGLGEIDISGSVLTVSVPANAYSGTYSQTLNLSLYAAP